MANGSSPRPRRLRDTCWLYKRDVVGDLETWAPTKDIALQTLRNHGFTNINPEKLIDIGDGSTVRIALSEM